MQMKFKIEMKEKEVEVKDVILFKMFIKMAKMMKLYICKKKKEKKRRIF